MSRPKKIKGSFCERISAPKSAFDRRSFRWTQSGRAWILIGCPKGEWQPRNGKCAVGTRAHIILAPSKRGRCSIGRKISK